MMVRRMATTADSAGPDPEPDPRRCDSAAEYVRYRLADADDPLSPSELAADYGCGAKHMRNVLSELAQEGEVERVSRGQYEAADADDQPDVEDLPSPDLDGLGEGEATEADRSDEGSSEGGDGSDVADSEMPTTEEYRHQHTVTEAGGTDPNRSDRTADDAGGTEANGSGRTSGDDAGTDPGGSDRTADEGPVGGAFALDPATVLVGVTVLVVVYLAFRSLGGGSSESSTSDDQDAADDPAEVEGGLVQDV